MRPAPAILFLAAGLAGGLGRDYRRRLLIDILVGLEEPADLFLRPTGRPAGNHSLHKTYVPSTFREQPMQIG